MLLKLLGILLPPAPSLFGWDVLLLWLLRLFCCLGTIATYVAGRITMPKIFEVVNKFKLPNCKSGGSCNWPGFDRLKESFTKIARAQKKKKARSLIEV
jgi:hypothetical protein